MEETGLTTFAWIFMIVSMGSVTILTAYCFYRILTTPRSPGTTATATRPERGRTRPGEGEPTSARRKDTEGKEPGTGGGPRG